MALLDRARSLIRGTRRRSEPSAAPQQQPLRVAPSAPVPQRGDEPLRSDEAGARQAPGALSEVQPVPSPEQTRAQSARKSNERTCSAESPGALPLAGTPAGTPVAKAEDLSSARLEPVRAYGPVRAAQVGYPPPPVYPSPRPGTGARTSTIWSPDVLVGAVESVDRGRRSVVADLDREPVAARWPQVGQVGHYQLESVPDFESARPLSEALVVEDEGEPGVLVADPLDRLELIRLVGIFLDGCHRRDLVTAGVTLSAFGFELVPRPSVVWLDGGRLRRLGDEFPRGVFEAPGSLDNDRAGFALVAHQLLVSRRADAPIAVGSTGHIAGLDAASVRHAWQLWERAIDREGARPPIREWLEVLA